MINKNLVKAFRVKLNRLTLYEISKLGEIILGFDDCKDCTTEYGSDKSDSILLVSQNNLLKSNPIGVEIRTSDSDIQFINPINGARFKLSEEQLNQIYILLTMNQEKSESDSSAKGVKFGVGELIQALVLYKSNAFEIRKPQLKLEIDQLNEKIKRLNFEKNKINSELSVIRSNVEERHQLLASFVNSTYSRKNIKKSIEVFFDLMNLKYIEIYSHKFIDNSENFKKMLASEIMNKSISDILTKYEFKHNSFKLKFKRCLSISVLLGISIFLFILSYEKFRPVTGYMYASEEYNFIGWLLNISAGFLAFACYGLFITMNSVPIKEVILIIGNNNDENLKEVVNFLDSIHKLPADIKKYIL